MRLLPRERRDALYAVYSYARRIDDIADGTGSASERLASLEQARAALAHRDEQRDDPVLVALADACRRYSMPLDAFDDLADGAAMDLTGARFTSFDDLVIYCRRVGGSIGRLAVGIFGAADRTRALALADALGVAFQLTNILRDVGEDLERGRIYLPQEDLDTFGCRLGSGGPNDGFAELVRFEASRAGEWYTTGLELLPLLDRPCTTSVAAMAGVYRRLLHRIERDPEAVLTRRLSLPTWEKGWVTARSLVGAAS
ncbi:MAG: squalene/phytoene synthase family protein [Actinobacteria bacterium]|nr:squalene/phytoene synthase family protein [Actinomycetota bacterium]